MYKYASKIFKANFLTWIPCIVTISFLSFLVALCFLHMTWVSKPSFLLQAQNYGLSLSEFRIISMTLYSIVLSLSAFSLWMIGKATSHQLRTDFALWRLVGATCSETVRCSLIFSSYTSAMGSLLGVTIACPLSYFILPQMNAMANGYQPYMTFSYRLDIPAIVGAFVLSFLTCFFSSGLCSFASGRIKPLELFRSMETPGKRMGMGRKIAGIFCLLYMILLCCTLPVMKSLNAGISSIYSLMLHIGFAGILWTFFLFPVLLKKTEQVLLFFSGKTKLRLRRVALLSDCHKIRKNNAAFLMLLAAFTLLTVLYLGTKMVMIAVLQTTGASRFNLSDSFIIALLTGFVALLTACSILILNFRSDRTQLAVIKTCGLTDAQHKVFLLYQALYFTALILILSSPTILLVSLTGTLGLAISGMRGVVLDPLPYLIAFLILPPFLYCVLSIPTKHALRGRWMEALKQF